MPLEKNEQNKIMDGDVGVIIKPDGTFVAFNCHSNFNSEDMTDAQREQGIKLGGLVTALRHKALMDILTDAFANIAEPVGSIH